MRKSKLPNKKCLYVPANTLEGCFCILFFCFQKQTPNSSPWLLSSVLTQAGENQGTQPDGDLPASVSQGKVVVSDCQTAQIQMCVCKRAVFLSHTSGCNCLAYWCSLMNVPRSLSRRSCCSSQSSALGLHKPMSSGSL